MGERTSLGNARIVGRRALGWIRREEAYLAALWLFAAILCYLSRTGLSFYLPFRAYVGYFAFPILLLLLLAKVIFPRVDRWEPTQRMAVWFKRFAFGRPEDRASSTEIELEFLRGMFLLFISLAMYTNVKVRIPVINPEIADSFFRDLDAALRLDGLAPMLEAWFKNSAPVADFFTDVYMHGYRFMIIIVCLLFLRRDVFHLRWVIAAVCYTYLLGVFVTVALPSLGPCFVRQEDFKWLRYLEPGQAQGWLMSIYGQVLTYGHKHLEIPAVAFAGIAAFPSLHVGHMVIMGVVAWRTCLPYVVVMCVVGLGTYVATIGFGWHYVVDGIGGALLAVAVTRLLYTRMRAWDALRVAT